MNKQPTAKHMPQKGKAASIKHMPETGSKATITNLPKRTPKPSRVQHGPKLHEPNPPKPIPFTTLIKRTLPSNDERKAMEILDRMAHHGIISPMDQNFIDTFCKHPVTEENAYTFLKELQHQALHK